MKNLKELFQSAVKSLTSEVEMAKLRFTEELLEIMEAKGISRSDLAKALDVKPARITTLLTGSNNFTIETMVRLCRAVGAKYEHHIQAPGCVTHWFDVPETKKVPVVKVMGTASEAESGKVIAFSAPQNLRSTKLSSTNNGELALAS